MTLFWPAVRITSYLTVYVRLWCFALISSYFGVFNGRLILFIIEINMNLKWLTRSSSCLCSYQLNVIENATFAYHSTYCNTLFRAQIRNLKRHNLSLQFLHTHIHAYPTVCPFIQVEISRKHPRRLTCFTPNADKSGSTSTRVPLNAIDTCSAVEARRTNTLICGSNRTQTKIVW